VWAASADAVGRMLRRCRMRGISRKKIRRSSALINFLGLGFTEAPVTCHGPGYDVRQLT